MLTSQVASNLTAFNDTYALLTAAGWPTDAIDQLMAKREEFAKNDNILPKIHIYCGVGDMLEEQLLPAAKEMKSLMVKHGYKEEKIHETYDEEKPHNEESWRQILPESFSFLLGIGGV